VSLGGILFIQNFTRYETQLKLYPFYFYYSNIPKFILFLYVLLLFGTYIETYIVICIFP